MPAQDAMRATRADVRAPDVSRAQMTPSALQPRAQPDDSHDDRSWHDQANCLGVDPDLFFPERGASTREAKEVCRGCVVREECLEYALSNGEKFGIWGGMSERERRRLRRARALARRGLGPTGAASA
jgi:WhiB family redox-sensing transcriptional regulator